MYSLLFASLMVTAPPQTPSAFSPVLHLRVISADGARVTFRPGTGAARLVSGDDAIGLRPGYIYRFRMDGFAEDPVASFDPSIEVRSTLFMPMNLKSAEFPATLRVTTDDVRRVLAGGMVTKVIYLEDPLIAVPEATTPELPLERHIVRPLDLVEEASKLGRVLAIVHLGGRSLSQQESIESDIPGTVQYPGEPLAPPSRPPVLPRKHFQWWDPIAGPRIPTEELLPDGGDIGPRIGINGDGHLGNLDATDTAIEFSSGDKKRSAVSNRICIFAPRFPVLRQEFIIAGFDVAEPPLTTIQALPPNLAKQEVPPRMTSAKTPPMAVINRLQPRATIARAGLHELELYRGGPMVQATVEGVRVQATVMEPATITQLHDQCKPNDPVVLIKTSDPREAKPGDVVTITIKYVNYGKNPLRDVTVADSLAGRLEYVPGSSRGDRPTTFTQQPNEAGSTILRWDVAGEVPPGQSGIVQFQAKVR